uniref:pyridoxal kinase n=1 Tax=Nelumbo nucifera TaxID=4432 RepID=A0A822YHE6_NELNU|nr:TPA_asm: hypothetical protein HUJ06_010861 [Nelumbo nucifera]
MLCSLLVTCPKSTGTRNLYTFRPRSSKKLAMAPPILSLALPSETGRVLSIQSHTVQGYVGNKAAVFPLQLLGYDVDPINSVQFSNHTGYPTFKGQVLNGQQLWDLIEGLEANDLLYYTHLLTGYIGSVSFLDTILKVIDKLRSVNPKLVYEDQPPQQFKIVIPKIPAYFTGTGDLTTALLLGWSNKYPDDLDRASELAVSSLQALLHRTVNDYKSVGFDPQSSSLEIRLIQSKDDICNPQVNYKAEKYH